MFVTATQLIIAKKEHRCTWCGQKILKGEKYSKWKSVDDSWFTSKMHAECHTAANDENHYWGDYEYVPFDNERPTKEEYETLQS